MDSDSFMEGRGFTGAVAAYREVALRDPRRYGFGYLAADPATGSPGAFLWFASAAEMVLASTRAWASE